MRGRPLAGSRSPVRTRPESPKNPSTDRDEPEMSRKDIAASLSSRDPACFRQTEDRALKSDAYRKTSNQEPTMGAPSQKGLRLPGLSSKADNLSSSGPRRDARRSSPAAEESRHAPEAPNLRFSVGSAPKQSTEKPAQPAQPAPLSGSSLTDANDSKPSGLHGATDTEPTLSRSSSVMGADRPPSPTKGLGGFVQSAMMRRSDSVSKRWSVQANSGLKRGDSIASNKPVFSPPAAPTGSLGHARTLSRDPRGLGDGTSSPLGGSRPSSSHDQSQLHQSFPDISRLGSGVSSPPTDVSEKATHVIPHDRPSTPPSTEPSLSRSPSKTLDHRRWSPTKASWLESALSKPESPRPTPLKPEPPSWKLDMQRSKSSKDLQESPKRPTSSFDSVTTGGLLRSPPAGTDTRLPPLFGDTLSKQSRSPETPLPEDDSNISKLVQAKSDKSATETLRKEPEVSSKVAQPEDRGKDIQQHNPATSQPTMDKPSSPPVTRPRPDFRSSRDKPPIALTPKPQTPPKTDFRANLKSRRTGDTSSKDGEPEFKAVFGKLKRTQTQNYVAPDVLKDNIGRGKAALNTTGGPQQTKRVDEFKESILAKKDAMKQGGGSVHRKDELQLEEQAVAVVPEALARRKTLHKAKPTAEIDTTNPPGNQQPVAENPARKLADLAAPNQESGIMSEPMPVPVKSAAVPKSVSEGPRQAGVSTTASQKPTAVLRHNAASLPKEFAPLPAARHDIPRQTDSVTSDPSQPYTAAAKHPERSPSPTKEVSGKLAARLNPSLAGLIGRVHSPKPQEESTALRPSPLDDSGGSQAVAAEIFAEDTSALQHMTKARARGPKRRAPKTDEKDITVKPSLLTASVTADSVSAISKAVEQLPGQPESTPSRTPLPKSSGPAPSPNISSVKPGRREPTPHAPEKSGAIEPEASRTPSESAPGAKVRPLVVSKSPELRRVSNTAPSAERKEERSLLKPTAAGKAFDIATDGTSQDTPLKSTITLRDISQQPVTRPLPLTPSKSKLNSPSKRIDSPSANLPAGKATAKPSGLGLNLNQEAMKTVTAGVLTPPSDTDLAVPALNPKHEVRQRNVTSASDIARAYFGTVPRSADRCEFDTEAFLIAQASQPTRLKTLSKQIWEVSGDGKRSTLPLGQDHILFEECMYLCVHTFETDKALKSTEAYLWAGDSVPDAAIEDAQLFCRKVARENSAKLQVVKQGKETSEFFSALGGIVIFRKTKSSALYMLCGRRHLGHVAFDEVEMSASRLCSGFPFLLSAKFGKLYLWKGQGGGVDEISAAKLISMDLSLTGEIEEVSEGAEPASFWGNFSDRRSFQSSETWSVRSMDQQTGFPCRLYRVEPERPKSSGGFWGLRASSPPKSSNKVALQELSPYAQQDLDPCSVHVLDTYATIYV